MRSGIENFDGISFHPVVDMLFLGAIFALSYLIFCLGLLIFGPILKWVLGVFSHQKEGEYPFLSPVAGYWSIVNGIILFNRNIFLEITRTTFLIVLFYRLMGMKIGKGTLINSTFLHDPDLITIGKNVTIGGDVMILGHVGERGVLRLKKVHLEDGTEVGQSSLIMPGVIMKEGSIVGAHSIVLKDTIIPPYEVWAGVPARKVAKLHKPGT
jgi:acetyltransferase-like isoleucine patch superfamily enzyme